MKFTKELIGKKAARYKWWYGDSCETDLKVWREENDVYVCSGCSRITTMMYLDICVQCMRKNVKRRVWTEAQFNKALRLIESDHAK